MDDEALKGLDNICDVNIRTAELYKLIKKLIGEINGYKEEIGQLSDENLRYRETLVLGGSDSTDSTEDASQSRNGSSI